MLIAALLAPLLGAFLTYCRGASIHGRAPLFFNRWLRQVNADEPSWRPERGWLVVLIGAWPAAVVWVLIEPLPPFGWLVSLIALADEVRAAKIAWLDWGWLTRLDAWTTLFPIERRAAVLVALFAWAGSCAAFTLGHARFQDGGTWSPPPDYVPEDTYLHDALGMAWTGGAMALLGALMLAAYGLWFAAALMLAGGVAKAAAYMIGWTGVCEKVFGAYWLPTRAAEVLQGFFLYGGASLALVIGGV